MKTVYRKVSFTYDYKDRGRWVRGCNEMDTPKEVEEIVAIIGAKKYRIIKRITTIKDGIVK